MADEKKTDLYPEMAENVAEVNNVVAGAVCLHCEHFRSCDSGDEGNCERLKCRTFKTDVCDHYTA